MKPAGIPAAAPGAHRARAAESRRGGRTILSAAAPCPVFIAYGDLAAARRATTHLAAWLRGARAPRPLQPMYWRFDQLDARGWREMALRDAVRAAVIVVALGDQAILPATAETWLSSLARCQHGATIRVLALLGDEAWTISLQQAAAATERLRPRGESLVALSAKIVAARAA